MRPRREKPASPTERLTVFDPETFSVAEVLQFLGASEKSGAVVVSAANESCVIKLVDGQIVEARSTQNPDGFRLGEILVERGAVRADLLATFLEGELPERLGRALATADVVTKEDVRDALLQQTHHLFQRCLDQGPVPVQFHSGHVSVSDVDLALDVTAALIEGMRLSDEARRVAV